MSDDWSSRNAIRTIGIISIISLLVTSLALASVKTVSAQEEEEAAWLPAHQAEGNLELSLDSSAAQWSQSHHAHAHGLDGAEMDLMCVHNGTYLVLLAERSFNASINMAGVALFLNGTLFGTSNAIWGWVGGQNNSTDPNVSSAGTIAGGVLTVVFGRPLAPVSRSEASLAIGVAYNDAVKVTSWSNGTAPTALSYDTVESMGLELLPHLDIFPRTPFIYAAVLLGGALAFVFLDIRRYHASASQS